MDRKERPVFLALLTVESAAIARTYPDFVCDKPSTSVIRSVLMKPEHKSYVPVLFREIETAALDLRKK
jgi:hypothetical protein